MTNYQYYNKEDSFKLNDGRVVAWPSYVLKAKRNYRVDPSTNLLYKHCSNCDSWYVVARIEDGIFVLDYREDEFRFHGGTFSSRCMKCLSELKDEQENKDREKYFQEFTKQGYSLESDIQVSKDGDYQLSSENKLYLKELALVSRVKEEDMLELIVTGLRQENVIEIKYTEKIARFW